MKTYTNAYSDPHCTALEEPMRNVMSRMGKAMWHFAQLKEITWYQWGYAGITGAIHYLEHVYGGYIDSFKELLAQMGLPLAYPGIPELREPFDSLAGIFARCIGLIDEVNDALSAFVEAADREALEPLARRAENIQMENFAPRAWLTQALTMSEQGGSASSLDSWLKDTLDAAQKG